MVLIPASDTHLSFAVHRTDLRSRILIPKYYDPELEAAARLAEGDFELPELGELLLPGVMGSRLGTWIRREFYGSGSIPFVRTSDLNAWRLRPDFKKGVSREVHDAVSKRQDVRLNDILLVAHGTYLIGTTAIVTEDDLPLVLQDHVFRLRLAPSPPRFAEAPVDPWLMLAALSTRFVKRQIRARQFSADIIDKIGDRHLEVRVPIPRDANLRRGISSSVQAIVKAQSLARAEIRQLLSSSMRMTRERSEAKHSFSVPRSGISQRILIPKYYDPDLQRNIREAEQRSGNRWVAIQQLVTRNLIEIGTGVEVGKMAYGTGSVPFIRTTDIAELEVKRDPRQLISTEIYEQFRHKAGLQSGDVLLVRDGTYLVGSSALVAQNDIPSLICAGIYRIRSIAPDVVGPATLLALLNIPLVRRQMRAKQFTRDVIDTLGKRLFEVLIPDPESAHSVALGTKLAAQMAAKGKLRIQIAEIVRSIEPEIPPASRSRPGWSMRG